MSLESRLISHASGPITTNFVGLTPSRELLAVKFGTNEGIRRYSHQMHHLKSDKSIRINPPKQRDANNSIDAAVVLKRDEWFKFKCWLGIDFEGDCNRPGAVW